MTADVENPTSYNYVLQVLALRGDDDDDLAADAEDLLGSNAAIDLETEVQVSLRCRMLIHLGLRA